MRHVVAMIFALFATSQADAEPTVARPTPTCTSVEFAKPCWIKARNAYCFVWNPNPEPGEKITYEGGCRHGRADGHGTSIWSDGHKYVGQLKSGKAHGLGTATWIGGELQGHTYVGQFNHGKAHGKGTLTLADGTQYVGEWKNSLEHGHGTYTGANGNRYVGEMRRGQRHGQGTFTWANNNKYVGEWKDGKMHGQGTFTRADRNKLVGEWKDGKMYRLEKHTRIIKLSADSPGSRSPAFVDAPSYAIELTPALGFVAIGDLVRIEGLGLQVSIRFSPWLSFDALGTLPWLRLIQYDQILEERYSEPESLTPRQSFDDKRLDWLFLFGPRASFPAEAEFFGQDIEAELFLTANIGLAALLETCLLHQEGCAPTPKMDIGLKVPPAGVTRFGTALALGLGIQVRFSRLLALTIAGRSIRYSHSSRDMASLRRGSQRLHLVTVGVGFLL